MKLRSLYILSIVGLLLVIVVQIGGMMYAYDNTKKEAERALNECFRLAFIETVDNEINLKSATTRLYDTEAKIICIVSKKGAQCIECHHKDI